MKDQLIFDTTDANTMAETDSVGAYVRSSDGTLITHTNVGGKDGLDVNIINSSIAVTASDLDIRNLTFADDKVDVSGSEVSLDAATLAALETITVEQGTSPWVVSATDLDIRQLQHDAVAPDSVQIGDGTEIMLVNGDGSINAVVTATQLDIDDLNATDDAVSSWTKDGSGNAITSTGGALDVNIASGITLEVNLDHANDSVKLGDGISFFTSSTMDSDIALDVYNILDLADASLVAAAQTLSATPNTIGDAVASPLSDRKYLYVYNDDNRRLYIGGAGMTAADGFPISPGSYMELRAGYNAAVKVISEKASHKLRTLEMA